MNFPKKMSQGDRLKLLGIKKWNEIAHWDEWSFHKRIVKSDEAWSLRADGWANENPSNIWISGPDGSLADVIRRFPGLEIEATFSDYYGSGVLDESDFGKIYLQDKIETLMDDENYWSLSDVEFSTPESTPFTKELLVRMYVGELMPAKLAELLSSGADPNVTEEGEGILRSFIDCGYEGESLSYGIRLLLKHGLALSLDKNSAEVLLELASKLAEERGSLPARTRLA